MAKGLVIKSTGSSYIVRIDGGTDVECHIKGNFRIRGIRSTNPVAVGDYVDVQGDNVQSTKDNKHGTLWITEVLDRKNYIIRKSTNLSKESHILAANIDQAALIVTLKHPDTSTTFIDRFLATCEAYRVPAILIFNKIDLLSEEELNEMEELQELYRSLDYTVISLCAKQLEEDGLAPDAPLYSYFTGKTTLLSGNSGVGKSTLLNALFGKKMTRTGKISDAHDKGMHTTTFSEMYPLDVQSDKGQGTKDNSGWIIDTPGIKGFGTFDMSKEEVSHYFREIFQIGRECRYSNCTHLNEPGCAVLEAVEHGQIAMSRFESYLSLLGDCEESKYR